MQVFTSPYASIDLMKGKNNKVAIVTWLGFAKESQYLEVLKKVVDLFSEHAIDYLILDQANMKAVTPNAINWIATDFAELISKYTKKVIIKKSDDIFGAISTNAIVEVLENRKAILSVHEEPETFHREIDLLFSALR